MGARLQYLSGLYYCTKKGLLLFWRGGKKKDSENFSDDNWGFDLVVSDDSGKRSHDDTDFLVEWIRLRPQRVKLVCATVFPLSTMLGFLLHYVLTAPF